MSVKINIDNNLEDLLKKKRPIITYSSKGEKMPVGPLNARLDFNLRENFKEDETYVCVK